LVADWHEFLDRKDHFISLLNAISEAESGDIGEHLAKE